MSMKGNNQDRHSLRGFTLIEVLVVITIIGILASISIPVVGRAIESARRAQARTEVASLDAAVRAYYNEYSRFPHQGSQDEYIDGNANLINVLRARPGTGNPNHANNRRRIIFLEAGERALTDSDNPDMIDPWGNPYRVLVDMNFNGVLTPPDHDSVEGRIVLVWSTGDNPGDPRRHLTSWK